MFQTYFLFHPDRRRQQEGSCEVPKGESNLLRAGLDFLIIRPQVLKLFAQIPELLPRLEAIEKNVYEPCTYCKYKPGEEGGENGGKGGGGKKKGGGGGGGKRGNSIAERGKGGGGSGGGKYAADIKAGKIPGEPGDKKTRMDNLCFRRFQNSKKHNFFMTIASKEYIL